MTARRHTSWPSPYSSLAMARAASRAASARLGEGLADGGHLGERVGGRDVERGDPQQPAAVGDAQGVERRAVRALVGHGVHEVAAHLLAGAALGTRGVDPVLRVSHQARRRVPSRPRARRGRGRARHRAWRASAAKAEMPHPGGSPSAARDSATRTSPSRHWSGSAVSPMTAARGSSLAVLEGGPDRQQRAVVDEPDASVGVGETEPGQGSLGRAGA